MSTRCHVELYDAWYKDHTKQEKTFSLGVRLYHHSDGYPSFMRNKLKRYLTAAYEYLKEAGYPYWWDSERVAAVLIALSIEDYEQPLKPFSTDRANSYAQKNGKYPEEYRVYGGVPAFQPCLNEHSDIEYVWKVVLQPEEGKFKISHTHVRWSDNKKKLIRA
jgi:hypothetical protein